MGKYEKGDLVRLKSGGPTMVVTHLHDGGIYSCDWFVGEEIKKGDSFPEEALVPAPSGTPVSPSPERKNPFPK
jgi:uncharacterized protein YodC (DUF2158 family)